MSEKREFPILNGKLLSDLDANGHKIINVDLEVAPEKIKEAVAPELEEKADATALAAEEKRAKEAEDALGKEIANKVNTADLPYALIEVPLADSINLTDRAINKVTVDDLLSSITFIFPEKVEGKSRDFFLRLVITGETVPTLLFVEPNGGAVSFDVDDDSWSEIEQGVNILMFSDTEE
jgi:hypothetical protein